MVVKSVLSLNPPEFVHSLSIRMQPIRSMRQNRRDQKYEAGNIEQFSYKYIYIAYSLELSCSRWGSQHLSCLQNGIWHILQPYLVLDVRWGLFQSLLSRRFLTVFVESPERGLRFPLTTLRDFLLASMHAEQLTGLTQSLFSVWWCVGYHSISLVERRKGVSWV